MSILIEQPGDACEFCEDVESDLYVCDGCGRKMCDECMATLADPDVPAEFCEECCEPAKEPS